MKWIDYNGVQMSFAYHSPEKMPRLAMDQQSNVEKDSTNEYGWDKLKQYFK